MVKVISRVVAHMRRRQAPRISAAVPVHTPLEQKVSNVAAKANPQTNKARDHTLATATSRT